VLIVVLISTYIKLLQNQKSALENSNYKKESLLLQNRLSSMIVQKQKSTLAIALLIADNDRLVKSIINRRFSDIYYKNLMSKIRKNTFYKNIWIQVFDNKGVSLYRSWTYYCGDNMLLYRNDIKRNLTSKKINYSISAGKYDLSIKANIPVFKNKKFIGIVEIISHFNSIANEFKKFNISSVVVLNKIYSKKLLYPFTTLFIGDNYIANKNAPLSKLKYLKEHGLKNYLHSGYKVENGYLVSSFSLKDINSKNIGYYIMFENIDNIPSIKLNFFMLKGIMYGIILFISVITIIVFILFFINKKQKKYYKNIIDSSSNIVIINDGKNILEVNKMFFKYFSRYKNLQEFKKENDCICDFFTNSDEYLQKDMNGVGWLNYILDKNNAINIAQMNIFNSQYYFAINASLISEEKHHYAIILTDITREEKYKQELENLIITDPLTGIKNRRYFTKKLKDEIERAKRYKHPLSIIMFDIDFFKKVNDRYGHDVGDEVLKQYSSFILSLLRVGDEFCRIGGEEFIIILPHANKDNSFKIANKIRVSIESSKKVVPITMSFGVVEYIDGEDATTMFKRVDNALYEAKKSGRNRVVLG